VPVAVVVDDDDCDVVDDCKNILLDFLRNATQASIAVSKSVSQACTYIQNVETQCIQAGQ
jgi:hypothetical protein